MSTSAAAPGTERGPAPGAGGSWLGARGGSRTGARWSGQRSVPHLLLGVLLVLACVMGMVMWSLYAGQRRSVLALARSVSVGQVLSAPDLRQVSIATDPEVSTMAASQASAVVGRTMATSLPTGALLSPGVLGPAWVPGPGQAVASLALRAGAVPPELGPGARVWVVFGSGSATGQASAPPPGEAVPVWPAVVLSVTSRAEEQLTVVSVQLAESAAREVAAVPAGQLSVVLLPGGGR